MNRIVLIQSAAGIATVVALPIIYLGATRDIPALTVIGFILFAVAMLTTPALRYLPQGQESPSPSEPANGGPTEARAREN